MPNGVKYSTTTPSGSLRRDNVALGVNGNLGPTATTGFYSVPVPQSGKYIINKVSVSGIPNFFAPANDTELIRFARNEGATGADTSSAAAVLAWIAIQPNLEAVNIEYENIVTDGLVLNLDAGFVGSYPTTGETIYNTGGNSNNGTLFSNPTYSSNNGGIITFNGTSQGGYTSNINWSGSFSVGMWVNLQSWRFINCPCSGVGNGVMSSLLQGADGYWNMWGLETNSYNNNTTGQAYFFTYYNTSYNGVSIGLGGSLNVWQYYFVSYNSTGNAVGYRNGSQVASQAITGQINPNVPLYINYRSQHCGDCWSENKTAIVQVYNRALTSTEVLQNYNAQKSRFSL